MILVFNLHRSPNWYRFSNSFQVSPVNVADGQTSVETCLRQMGSWHEAPHISTVDLLFRNLNMNVGAQRAFVRTKFLDLKPQMFTETRMMNVCKTWGMWSNNAVANNSRLLFMACVFHQVGMSVQHCTVLHYIPNVFHSVCLSYFIEYIEMYKTADKDASKLSMVAGDWEKSVSLRVSSHWSLWRCCRR